ncbi:hypothetical protein LT493_21400 [Streptomyces tricolor]|nr:hypothetical protein [Streptomyces tricolor]
MTAARTSWRASPFEDFGGLRSPGTFAVVPGGRSGVTGAGTKVFGQDSAGVPGTAEKDDWFGAAVHLVDGDGDGRAEPVAAAPWEDNRAGAFLGVPGPDERQGSLRGRRAHARHGRVRRRTRLRLPQLTTFHSLFQDNRELLSSAPHPAGARHRSRPRHRPRPRGRRARCPRARGLPGRP